MDEAEFKEKARREVFNASLKSFPVIFEMYARAFKLEVDLDDAMASIVSNVRTSSDSATAYSRVTAYLDSIEGVPNGE